jgi:hypothetical protein
VSDIPDPRHISHGWEIPTVNYADQPYVVKTDDGAWLCCVTTGEGREGQPGQHVITLRSTDQGRTWDQPVPVEPLGGPEASYAVLLKVPTGRVYCFYNHNTDNLREIVGDDPPFKGGICKRVDSLGYFVFKYSDDHGRTWSDERTPIPMREMDIDRTNPTGGKVRFGWNVGRAFIHDGEAFVSFHKVGRFGSGFFVRSEGVLVASRNILSETDPSKITWETLPEGDFGLRTPPGGGLVAEEQSYTILSDGSIYCVYRTVDGYPAFAISRDKGRTWSEPAYQCFANGRRMKHPRAANFVWRCENGRYVYWFHNHGGSFVRTLPASGNRFTDPYKGRNPVWLSGGVEADTPEGKTIRWSEPEVFIYDDDPMVRMSYPDLVEDGGSVYITETEKQTARTHRVDPTLLAGMWGQLEGVAVAATDALLLEQAGAVPAEVKMPVLPAFNTRDHSSFTMGMKDERAGFTIDLAVTLDDVAPGQVILDSRGEDGRGIALLTAPGGAVELVLSDSYTENRWHCEPGLLQQGRTHHVSVIVDGGPKIIVFVIDGVVVDGGDSRDYGWGRFSPYLTDVSGAETLRVADGLRGRVADLRIYGRALRTSEAIGNSRARGAG